MHSRGWLYAYKLWAVQSGPSGLSLLKAPEVGYGGDLEGGSWRSLREEWRVNKITLYYMKFSRIYICIYMDVLLK